jgi:hypothetical protein
MTRERAMAASQISSKDLQDSLGNFKMEEDWLLDMLRLEDVETLTDIISQDRVNGARSNEIARAIMKFVKKGKG